MKELFIVRHGQTDFNKARIIQGRGIDSSLNEKGNWQAKQFYEHYKNENFEVAVISELKRTFESLKPFIDDGLEHIKTSNIDEISWGEYEGKPSDKNLLDYYKSITDQWKNGKYDVAVKGGETILELAARLENFIKEVEEMPNEKILVCTHGRTLRCLMCLLLDKPLSEMDKIQHRNLTLYHVKQNGENWELLKANDVGHLEN